MEPEIERMLTTKEWLDKIKWDTNEDSSNYSFTYIDLGKERKVKYDRIISRDEFSFCINQDGILSEIPYHRIRKIFKNDKIVFSRRNQK